MMKMKIFVWLTLILSTSASAQYPTMSRPPPDMSHPDTNSDVVSNWFTYLQNREGSSCCGIGDAYEAAIDVEATPTKPGRGYVIDPSAREVWHNGYLVAKRPALSGDLSFTFEYQKMTPEKLGNPTRTAMVFLNIRDGKIDRANYYGGVYCVVTLPPMF
jgi:hypothetical protein